MRHSKRAKFSTYFATAKRTLSRLQAKSCFSLQRPGKFLVFAVLAALISQGCVKPAPERPEIQQEAMKATVLTNPWTAAGFAAGPIAGNWLASFNDPELATLVTEAVANNPDLRVGATRVEQAGEYVNMAKAALRPAVSILGKGSFKGGDDGSMGLSGGILGAAWEIDLWGKLRYARNAAKENYASAQADYEYARQSIAAMTARNWFLATETWLQIQLGQEMVAFSEQYLDLALTRHRVGVGDEQDVVVAQANVSSYLDGLRQVQLAHQQTLRGLEQMLGRYPAAELKARLELDKMPGPVPAGVPLEVLERRPDIIAAERRVAAAFNRVGEAKAARLPSLKLTANFGAIASSILQLKDDFSNPIGGVGIGMLAPIYMGGALKTQVRIRTIEQKTAVAEYARMALRAITDVENALAAANTLKEREVILTAMVDQNRRALELEETSYRVGKVDMRGVRQRQLTLYGAQITLLRVQSEQLIQRVNLHLALGGSFS
jgi:multidrug efflux system outer membrane protein